MTVNGGSGSLPSIRAVTLNAVTIRRRARATSVTVVCCSAWSLRNADCSLETCNTGAARLQEEVRVVRTEPGAPAARHAHQRAMTMLPSRLAQGSRRRGVGGASTTPISASLPIGPSTANAGVVGEGPIEQRQAFDAPVADREMTGSIDPVQRERSRAGRHPRRRTSSNSQSPERRSTSVPVRWKPCWPYSTITRDACRRVGRALSLPSERSRWQTPAADGARGHRHPTPGGHRRATHASASSIPEPRRVIKPRVTSAGPSSPCDQH